MFLHAISQLLSHLVTTVYHKLYSYFSVHPLLHCPPWHTGTHSLIY